MLIDFAFLAKNIFKETIVHDIGTQGMLLKASIFFSLGSLFLIFGNYSLKAAIKGRIGGKINHKGMTYIFLLKINQTVGQNDTQSERGYLRKVTQL